MTTARTLCTLIPALALYGAGCSGDDVTPPSGSGGTQASGGASPTGGFPNGGTAGATATGGTLATGGATSGGSGGTLATGGTTSGGSGGALSTGGAASGSGGAGATGGAPSGGSGGSGGAVAGGSGGSTGGTPPMGGSGGIGGTAGKGGAAGKGGSGGGNVGGAGGGLLPGNTAVPSAGCGKATTVTNGKKTITSTNQQRTYIIDIPTNYDMNKPYRLFYTSHWIGSTSEAVRDQNYYFLKPLATAANQPAIFVAPQSDGQTWQQKDHALFDDILTFVKANLCIDTTRVFATGFSFGGMITYSLSVNHQKDIRAGVGIAPANYNIYVPPKTHEPIAWMQTTGMSDTTCPWVQGSSTTNGAKFIAIEHATDNGCTIPANVPNWQSGNHLCYDFQGCRAGYPVKACTFNGSHTNIATSPAATGLPTNPGDSSRNSKILT